MIKEKYVTINIGSKSIKHYKDKGYNVKTNTKSKIKVEDLTKGSKTEVTAICDVCSNEKIITYKEYNRNIKKHNIYTCNNKCAQIKNKLTSFEKYGVEHFSKTDGFIQKTIDTTQKKYGVDFYTQSEN